MFRITIETDSYNQRRYGKPWIAKVDFSESTKGDFNWGEWTGDHWNGGSGILSIDVAVGDIVATGQKDNRKPRNSAPDFSFVDDSGNLVEIGDKGAAYKHYLANKPIEKPDPPERNAFEILLNALHKIDGLDARYIRNLQDIGVKLNVVK